MNKFLLVGLVVAVALVSGAVAVFAMENQVIVTFSDDRKPIVATGFHDTLAEALESEGENVAELKKDYQPSIPWDQPLKGDQVEVQLTCRCKVTLEVGGQTVGTYVTTQSTVGGFLKEHNVSIGQWDELNTPLDEKIKNGMTITIDKVEQRVKKEVKEIPFETKEEKDDQLYKGEKKVVQEGKKGYEIYQITALYKNGQPVMKDGEPVMVKKLIEKVEPVTELVKIGTKDKESNIIKIMTVEATGYTPTGNRTATGTWPHHGTIAVDPNVIPLGTKMYVPGYGCGVAEDTGGAVKGKIIDLLFETEQEAIQWGRRTVTIQIVKECPAPAPAS
jgi:3D (Asp-Asp-Asp) domain-containing protein